MIGQIIAYLALLVLISGVAYRIGRSIAMPVHLRWELYPLPHERGRAEYGGSIMEEVNWWTKPRHVDYLGTVRAMGREILLLKGIFEDQRVLWWGSFPLHWGLYFFVAGITLTVASAGMHLIGASALSSSMLLIVPTLAWLSFCLGGIGSTTVLAMRLFNRKLRIYSNLGHYFNLLLLGALFISGLVWLVRDNGWLEHAGEWLSGLIAFHQSSQMPIPGVWHIGFVMLFTIYFPFTRMTHAFMKFFTYHYVRWEDHPNVAGGKLQRKIEQMENQPVTWAAPHINAEGRKTWVDLADETGAEKKP
jgi:nitrate reductase gamma subunit